MVSWFFHNWSAFLVKAEVREEFKALGVRVQVLKDISKEIGKVAPRQVEDFLPLPERPAGSQRVSGGHGVGCLTAGDPPEARIGADAHHLGGLRSTGHERPGADCAVRASGVLGHFRAVDGRRL